MVGLVIFALVFVAFAVVVVFKCIRQSRGQDAARRQGQQGTTFQRFNDAQPAAAGKRHASGRV